MDKLGIIIATILLWTLFVAVVFGLTVLIASAINHVVFYEQLCLWFGHGSNFAKIFIK